MKKKTSKKYVKEVLDRLEAHYPKSKTALDYSTPWQLLIAVILSAQCTDKRVNMVTKKLFSKYKSIEDIANADLKEFENDIRSTGFYRNKAKNIIATAKILVDKYDGKVPDNMDDLLELKGVARKTANVVLGVIYNKTDGVVVDTHVKRLSNRLGFTNEKNPVKIEKDLIEIIPRSKRFKLSNRLIDHGRAICKARKPMCGDCFLNDICPSAFKIN